MTLQKFAELEGYAEVIDMLEDAAFDSVCPAICTNKGCDYFDQLEPDAHHCRCDNCQTNTVHSVLIIAGVI